MFERLERMPVPVLPTMVGALTLSNVYSGMGFPWVRHLTMWAATIVLALYIIKIVLYPKTCVNEYKTTIPSSLYAGFFMVMMILGSYYFDYIPALGKGMWAVAIVLHAAHILVFTYRNILTERNIHTTMPSWFVTYNGIMVSCVVGGAMNAAGILKYIVYYGIAIYFILIPVMIWRMLNVEIKAPVYHTQAVVLAPCSLCVVSVLNVLENPAPVLVYVLYACVLASLLFIVLKLPQFFSFPFVPGYAGLTFPMCIGIVATNKFAGFVAAQGNEGLSEMLKQLGGIQTYLTTFIVGYVLLNFIMKALRTQKPA